MIIDIKKNIGVENYFNLTYVVTNSCNYHCPYCMQGNKPKKDTTQTLIETISKQINKTILYLKEKGKNIDFHLIGGEVSIYDIKKLILNNINLNNIYRFSMVTNLSRNVEYYEDLFDYLIKNNVNIRIKASYHPTEISQEKFFYKVNKLKKYNIIVSLLITKEKYFDIVKFNNFLSKENIKTSVSVERINGIPIDINFLTDSEREIISNDKCIFHVLYDNKKIKQLTKFDLLNSIKTTKNYLCDINSSRLIIGPKGNIKNICSQQNNNGTIFNYKFNDNIIKCKEEKACTLYAINELKYDK